MVVVIVSLIVVIKWRRLEIVDRSLFDARIRWGRQIGRRKGCAMVVEWRRRKERKGSDLIVSR